MPSRYVINMVQDNYFWHLSFLLQEKQSDGLVQLCIGHDHVAPDTAEMIPLLWIGSR